MADLVSVVVPCFNAERWLAAAIRSALDQTWSELEVLVIDDGSTDGSVEIARSFSDRVRVSTGPNQGPAKARNRGVREARGRFVQFLDADDLLLPRKVELCLAQAIGPDVIPFARLLPFGGPPRSALATWAASLAPLRRFDPTRPVETALTVECQTSQALYPVERLRAVGGFNEELRWLEDIDLNLRLVLAGARYVPVDVPLVLLRDHAGPGRLRLSPGAAAGRLVGEVAMIEATRAAGRLDPGIARVFADRLAYAGRQAAIAGRWDVAADAFARASALHPRPRPTQFDAYNRVAWTLGLERTERLAAGLRTLRRG